MVNHIRILIADDQKQARAQARVLVERQQRMQVIAEAGNGQDVLTEVLNHSPEIVLMDINMPRLDGLQVLERIKQDSLRTQVIMVSGRTNRVWVMESQRLGAKGYVAKQDLDDELITAIEAVVNGERYVSRSLRQERSRVSSPLHDGGSMEVQKQSAGDYESSLGKRVRGQLQAKQNGTTQHGKKKVRILILDDEPFVRDHIHAIHKGDTQFEIVPYNQQMLVKRDPDTALQMVSQAEPDVIVLDLLWQDGKQSGWMMLKQLRISHSHIPIIVFSNSSKRIHVNEAVQMGARGYVAKIDWKQDLIPAILKVTEGDTAYSRSVPIPENRKVDGLTEMETEVFRLYVKGYTRMEIAQELFTNGNGVVNRNDVDGYFFRMKDKTKLGEPEGWRGVAKAAYGVRWELDAREREVFDCYVEGTKETEKLAQILRVPKTVVKESMQTVRRKLRCPPWKWTGRAKAENALGDQELLCELNARERKLFDCYVRGMTAIDKLVEVLEVPETLVKECVQAVRRKLGTHPEGWKGIAKEHRLID